MKKLITKTLLGIMTLTTVFIGGMMTSYAKERYIPDNLPMEEDVLAYVYTGGYTWDVFHKGKFDGTGYLPIDSFREPVTEKMLIEHIRDRDRRFKIFSNKRIVYLPDENGNTAESDLYSGKIRIKVSPIDNSREAVTQEEWDELLANYNAKQKRINELKNKAASTTSNNSSGTRTELPPTTIKYGWQKTNEGWKFFTALTDTYINGWYNDLGTWYYFEDEVMQTDWINDNNKWYYLNANGSMATGWINTNGLWYYMANSGEMLTGWIQDNGKWYYLNNTGELLVNTTTPDGYTVNEKGEWVQ